jgi:hypothetical protein
MSLLFFKLRLLTLRRYYFSTLTNTADTFILSIKENIIISSSAFPIFPSHHEQTPDVLCINYDILNKYMEK